MGNFIFVLVVIAICAAIFMPVISMFRKGDTPEVYEHTSNGEDQKADAVYLRCLQGRTAFIEGNALIILARNNRRVVPVRSITSVQFKEPKAVSNGAIFIYTAGDIARVGKYSDKVLYFTEDEAHNARKLYDALLESL